MFSSVFYDQLSVYWRTGRFRTGTACRQWLARLSAKNLEREIKFNENELKAFYFKKDTNRKV